MMETTVKRPPARILAIETASPRGSVAADAGAGVVERRLDEDGQHGRLVGSGLEEVAIAAGFAVETVEVVAVVRGPGSFTGVRVGVALAKTLAWSTGATLIGVSGYDIVAHRAGSAAEASIVVAFDAGRGDLAVARCTWDPATAAWSCPAPRLLTVAAVADWLAPGERVAGPGAARLAGASATSPPAPWFAWPTAAEALRLGMARVAAGVADDAARLQPDYLRPAYVDDPRQG